MFKNKVFLLLILIFVLGGVLRLTDQFHFSPSLNWDETSLGYNAYSVFLTGRDEWGNLLPVVFRAFGDYKLPLYVYLSVVPAGLFGLSPFSVRLTSEIAGSLLILVTYMIARKFHLGKKTALLSALLVSLEPWTLFLSKIALEANLAILILGLGVALALYRRFTLSLIFFGLSVWTYNSARVFTPLFLVTLFLVYRGSFIRQVLNTPRKILTHLVIGFIFFVPMFYHLFSPTGLARFNWLSLLDSGAVTRIENSRNLSSFPSPFPRLLYNRPVYFISQFSQNYFRHFLPAFLFLKGGSQYQFNIPGVGLLYRINLPFFYLGLILLLVKRHRYTPLIFIWLVLAPIAGSITRDSPHTLRAIPLLPLPMIFSAVGLSFVVTLFKKNWWLPVILYTTLFILSFNQFFFSHAKVYRTRFSDSWQYGHVQLVAYLQSVYTQYDRIIITKRYGEPHIFILFNWPWSPEKLNADPRLNRYFRSNWYWVDAFDKFIFVNDWDLPEYVSRHPAGRTLIVASPENIPRAAELDRILFLDGRPAFILQTQ